MSKKIGFVDYYISEWHANHYPEWIAQANEVLGTDYQVAYAWAELDVSPLDNVTTDQWCEKFGAERCATIEELCEKSDYIIVLAPSDPDKHLGYAQKVLPFGKRTYIDKTFAPNYATAKQIFDIAAKHNTAFFSTSALRCATELKEIGDVRSIMITGSGSNFEEYCIHMVEMAVMLLKDPAVRVKVESLARQRICRVQTQSGKDAALLYTPATSYMVMAQQEDGKCCKQLITSSFFVELLRDILQFFESGELPFPAEQTLEVMRVRDALLAAEAADGQWLQVGV